MLEMPQPYVNSPNARLAYMLKSFTLKQWDIARRKIYQEIKKEMFLKVQKILLC